MSTLALALMVLGAIAAFAYGIWAGLGTYQQDPEEIERAMEEPGRRRKATRHFTPLDLVARMTGVPTHRDRANPFRFDKEDAPPTQSRKQQSQPPPSTSSDQGVEGDQDGADDGAEKVSEPDDQA